MSKANQSPVIMFDDDDPLMQQAHENARRTFRYFWRELSWERRRIVPALDLACVKAPFSDGPRKPTGKDPKVEHMWISEVDFDGRLVSGELINSPNWLKSVKEGDAVQVPLSQISDWMYAIASVVYGGYTVNLLRSRMSRSERKDHDSAWGLDFGDPASIRLVPEPKKSGGFLSGLFGKKEKVNVAAESGEHPMSENMVPSLEKQLRKDRTLITQTDDNGWTLLHQESLAGNASIVKLLLASGADPTAKTHAGQTPLQLAKSLGWTNVVALLAPR